MTKLRPAKRLKATASLEDLQKERDELANSVQCKRMVLKELNSFEVR